MIKYAKDRDKAILRRLAYELNGNSYNGDYLHNSSGYMLRR